MSNRAQRRKQQQQAHRQWKKRIGKSQRIALREAEARKHRQQKHTLKAGSPEEVGIYHELSNGTKVRDPQEKAITQFFVDAEQSPDGADAVNALIPLSLREFGRTQETFMKLLFVLTAREDIHRNQGNTELADTYERHLTIIKEVKGL